MAEFGDGQYRGGCQPWPLLRAEDQGTAVSPQQGPRGLPNGQYGLGRGSDGILCIFDQILHGQTCVRCYSAKSSRRVRHYTDPWDDSVSM